MAEETTPTSPETTTLPPNVTIRKDVADALSGVAPKIRTMVVDELTTQEITRRKDAVLSVLEKIREKENELKKLEKKGTQSFDVKGGKVGEPTFTQEQISEMKKIREDIEKFQKALSKAFDENDFSKLLEIANAK